MKDEDFKRKNNHHKNKSQNKVFRCHKNDRGFFCYQIINRNFKDKSRNFSKFDRSLNVYYESFYQIVQSLKNFIVEIGEMSYFSIRFLKEFYKNLMNFKNS